MEPITVPGMSGNADVNMVMDRGTGTVATKYPTNWSTVMGADDGQPFTWADPYSPTTRFDDVWLTMATLPGLPDPTAVMVPPHPLPPAYR